jgi:hypothetical protein
MSPRHLECIVVCIAIVLAFAAQGAAQDNVVHELTSRVERAASRTSDQLNPKQTQLLARTVRDHDMAAGEVVFQSAASASKLLATTYDLLAAQDSVDAALERLLALRSKFVEIEDETRQRATIREFLQQTTALIDLSGRLRYLLGDAIRGSAQRVRHDRETQLALLEKLIEHQSGIGAGVMVSLLDEEVDNWTKGKVLQLVAVSQECDLLPQIAAFIRDEATPPGLLLLAGECVRYVGLPQDPHPLQAKDTPPPAIAASELLARMKSIDTSRLSERGQSRLADLVAWLEVRQGQGVTEDGYRFFGHTVREGDWFLMRNPSPYNMFTDLSPGLFTHVGVVTIDVGDDGKRRFVLVDLPERGEKIPVSNVDAYVLRTLNYFFLRHRDAKAAKTMGAAARAMIGNPSNFDLNFRTDRVAEYRGKPLAGAMIHTYCAGFLLICAQETGLPREDFFPIIEYPAGGRTQANLKTLGLSLGEDFISPTAALFSPKMEIAGRRRPMYDPQREVQEAVYDHFALQMNTGTLRQSPSAQQALREKLVRISSDTPWLRRAIAKANGVSEEMDLLSAARAAAVVETLDEIADTSAAAFQATREAFLAPPDSELRRRGYSAEKSAEILAIRRREQPLYDEWRSRRITPPTLQRRLINQASEAGRKRLDARFFTAP